MDTIRETLYLEKATIVDLSYYPGEKGMNCVLVLKAPLTSEASKILKCESRFFNLNDTPYTDFQGRITLKPVVKSCFVKIADRVDSANALIPDLIWKFNIGLEKDSKPSVAFRAHFDAKWRNILADIVNALNTDEFPIEIVGLQRSLFIDADMNESGEGTHIDLSGKTSDDAQMELGEVAAEEICRHCVNGVPRDDFGQHENGAPCEYRKAATAAVAQIPAESAHTLPSVREMAGGTTAAAKKARGPRGRLVEEAPTEHLTDDLEPIREFEPV